MASRPAVPAAGLRCPGAPPPLLPVVVVVVMALLGASWGQPVSFQVDVNGYSLHPPYFNLAEGTKISATATCGEEEAGGRSPPRPVEDLYCKLVGGPVSGGEPNQTIQVGRFLAGVFVCVCVRAGVVEGGEERLQQV